MEAATPTQTATMPRRYVAKQHNYQLWVKQPMDLRDELGRKYGQTPLLAVVFEDHIFVADEKSAADLEMTLDELIDWLSGHEQMNSMFFDEGNPPDAVSPSVKEQSEVILKAVADNDPDTLGELIAEERATHDRPAVIQMGEAALEQLSGRES